MHMRLVALEDSLVGLVILIGWRTYQAVVADTPGTVAEALTATATPASQRGRTQG